jgi:hypothetical protein
LNLVASAVLQKHAQHVEALSVAGEDAIHEFDLLGCSVQPLVELFIRPPASLTPNVPLDGFYWIAPLTDLRLKLFDPDKARGHRPSRVTCDLPPHTAVQGQDPEQLGTA